MGSGDWRVLETLEQAGPQGKLVNAIGVLLLFVPNAAHQSREEKIKKSKIRRATNMPLADNEHVKDKEFNSKNCRRHIIYRRQCQSDLKKQIGHWHFNDLFHPFLLIR